MEKKSDPVSSWIDAEQGRVAEIANPVKLQRSPRILFRTAKSLLTEVGRFSARFHSVVKHQDELLVFLSLTDASSHGQLAVVANLGAEPTLDEFLDYTPGSVVQVEAAAMSTVVPLELIPQELIDKTSLPYLALNEAGIVPQFFVGTIEDPLTERLVLTTHCRMIRLQSRPETEVTRAGTRRSNLEPDASEIDLAYAQPEKHQGRHFSWSGTL